MPLVPESYLSPDDYPQRPEHALAPSYERLAGITAQVQQLASELPLSEAAELLGPAYGSYLNEQFERRARGRQPAQALPYAEALVTCQPDSPDYRARRAWCYAQQSPPNYAAALADYAWLARRPRPSYEDWLRVVTEANPDSPFAENADQARHEHGRDLVLLAGAGLACAWAYYNLGDRAAAEAAFQQALSLPDLPIDHGYDHYSWQPGMLPPAVDTDFLRWRLNQPDPRTWPEPVQEWSGVILRRLYWLLD